MDVISEEIIVGSVSENGIGNETSVGLFCLNLAEHGTEKDAFLGKLKMLAWEGKPEVKLCLLEFK